MQKNIASYFQGQQDRRIYIQIDKPMYQPGETIWVKTWDLKELDLGASPYRSIEYMLINPKGAVVMQKAVRQIKGQATNDFELPRDIEGGEYTLRVNAYNTKAERPVVISSYEAPRLKKKLEFVRKAYGEGDEVTATIEVKRPTGEALANHPLTAMVRLDGVDLPNVQLNTDAQGNGLVRFTLPTPINVGDGLLTVLVEDGGITESVSKRIPIIVRKLQFSAFPEGGKLIEGLSSRLYFEAKTPLGKPADVEGRIVDDVGNAVASFKTYRDGLGRVEFAPSTGRNYHVEITRPLGVSEHYAVPLTEAEGCVLRSFDDLDGELTALRVQVQCTEAKKVRVVAMLRDNLLDAALVQVTPGVPAVVYLESKDPAMARAQGVARVTVFDEKDQPLAERLVYRNRRAQLGIEVKPDRDHYAPRDPVNLQITTRDLSGKPIAADLALSVVDDTVVSFADDKTGHIYSRLYLEPELVGKIEEPNFYFDLTEEKSGLAMDLLMGTRGWRTFEWRRVLNPMPTSGAQAIFGQGSMAAGALDRNEMPERKHGEKTKGAILKPAERAAGPRPPPPPQAAPTPPVLNPWPDAKKAEKKPVALDTVTKTVAEMPTVPAKPMTTPMAVATATPPKQKVVPGDTKNRAGGGAPAGLVQREAAGKEMPAQHHGHQAFKQNQNALGEDDNDLHDIPPVDHPAAVDEAGLIGNLNVGVAARRVAVEWAPVRVFPAPVYAANDMNNVRTDFRETLHWEPSVHTDSEGHAKVSFYTSDAITSFRIFTEGVGAGAAGRNETVFSSSLPFSMGVKLPLEVSAGDTLLLPLTLSNERNQPLDVTVNATFGNLLTAKKDLDKGGLLAANARKSLFYPLEVTGQSGESEVHVVARTGSLQDEFSRKVSVTRLGFPQVISRSGKIKGTATEEFDLGEAIEGSADVTLKLYPSPVATLVSGLEGMLREPSGCFEQTSSTNYPNVMVISYLRSHDVADPALLERSGKLLESGYRKLTGFESPNKGYEWFGGDPGHEALTAYGLLEFADMKRVYGNVDDEMFQRTARWLKNRRDGKGGYLRDAKAIDSFGRASPEVTNAYITYSLVRAGETGLETEVATTAQLARETSDSYLLALAANTLLRVPARRTEGFEATKKLISLQEADGSWTKESQSITRSGGSNLYVETTSLAVLAMLESGSHDAELRKAIEWLQKNRSGFGRWGATQATVLALEAMTAYDESNRKTPEPGIVVLRVNGETVGQVAFEAGRREPLVFTDVSRHLRSGKNKLELTQEGGDGLPYSLAVEFRSLKPATSPESVVDLSTALERTQVKMGESVRLNATVTNKTQSGQPMTMARVGLPGGLTFQNWQLKELREKGLIAFYETRPREVILYFRDMKPSEVKQIPLDLVASVPGHFTGPASSAYLYYTDQYKTWADAVAVDIQP
jgi:uncharacterized protein YfaS (alpha-2-macroglobulin family)